MVSVVSGAWVSTVSGTTVSGTSVSSVVSTVSGTTVSAVSGTTVSGTSVSSVVSGTRISVVAVTSITSMVSPDTRVSVVAVSSMVSTISDTRVSAVSSMVSPETRVSVVTSVVSTMVSVVSATSLASTSSMPTMLRRKFIEVLRNQPLLARAKPVASLILVAISSVGVLSWGMVVVSWSSPRQARVSSWSTAVATVVITASGTFLVMVPVMVGPASLIPSMTKSSTVL